MAKQPGVCTKEMTKFLKWRNLPSLNNYIQSQFRCEKAYTLMAEAQSSGFENKDALKQAANIFFDILREEPFIQAYVGLGYLFLLLDQKNNAILYLAAAHRINPHDGDTIKLLEHTLAEDPNLKSHVQDPSFNDDEEDLYNFLDDHGSLDDNNHLDDLPAELLVLIFDWLKPASVAKFRQVNKYFRDLLVHDVYWQDKYAQRWVLPNIELIKKVHAKIPDGQFYHRFYQLNHNSTVNWLNRTTKFEKIKKIKGSPDALCTAPALGVITVHSLQPQEKAGQYKRLIEFFRFKRGKLHRVKRAQVQQGVAQARNRSTTTFTADHLISYIDADTLVFTEIAKKESKIHKAAGTIDAICGLPTTNGIQFLAGHEKSVTYFDGLETKKTIEIGENHYKIGKIIAQHDGTHAAILNFHTGNFGHSTVKILDIESASVVNAFSAGTHNNIEWMMALPHVLIGLDTGVTFYDVRTNNKFEVPKRLQPPNETVLGVAMDDVKLFALQRTALTLFDCRYSSSIVEHVALPENHCAVPGLALWCSQKVYYANHGLIPAYKGAVVEWDLGQVIK